jgi:hypothetical protein
LGHPNQLVQAGITPNQNDLISVQEYDAFGRESKSWLPIPKAGNNGAYYDVTNLANNSQSTYANDTAAYSETKYEPSPLNRVTKQYGPGQAWCAGNGHADSIVYLTNNSTYPCKYYSVSGNSLASNGNYDDNTLFVTKMIEEDDNGCFSYKIFCYNEI